MIFKPRLFKTAKGLSALCVVLVLFSCLLFLWACVGDNFFSFNIKVLEWIDAPSSAESQVFIDSTPSDSIRSIAVDNATIEIYAFKSTDHLGGYTNRAGIFREDFSIAPGVVPFRVLAWKAGFQKAETSVKSGNHSIVFLLVREKASNN